jgi:hypothetical protein
MTLSLLRTASPFGPAAWAMKFGTVVRDLSVEKNVNTPFVVGKHSIPTLPFRAVGEHPVQAVLGKTRRTEF